MQRQSSVGWGGGAVGEAVVVWCDNIFASAQFASAVFCDAEAAGVCESQGGRGMNVGR